MPRDSGNGSGHAVEWPKLVMTHIRFLSSIAFRQGRARELLTALKRAYTELQLHPHELGEPLYRLPGMRLEVRCVVFRPLLIEYAVFDELPLVVVKGVQLLGMPPGRPIAARRPRKYTNNRWHPPNLRAACTLWAPGPAIQRS
jgi:hypothetical protein